MNQNFTVKKMQYLSKKKIVQVVSPEKKNSCTSSARKKKFLPAENPSPTPITFLMVRPLENATTKSIKKGTKCGIKIFQGKNLKTLF